MHPQLIEPPSSRTILEKSRVKASYLDFWNHIKNNSALFPVYTPDIVEDLFDRASEIVARIRILLNRQNPSAQILRKSCGLSKEKLWDEQLSEKPIDSPEEFVHDLVHKSLQDVKGKYINGLTKEKVDEYIHTIEQYLDQNRSSQEKNLLAQFRGDVEEMSTLLQNVNLDEYPWKNYALFLNLKKLASEGSSLKNKLQALLTAKDQVASQKETPTEESPESQPETPSDKEERQEDIVPDNTPKEENKETEGQKTEEEAVQTESQKEEKTDSEASAKESQSDAAQSPEDSESSEAEGSRTPTNTRKKYEIKINQVADDVSLLRGKVQHLSEVAEKLDLSELAKDPNEGSKAVNELQKKCLQYTEHLMKNLLSLDEIIGSTSTRSQKKQQITTIQELMSDMDSVNDRLKKFSETLKAETEAEEREREKKRKLLEEQEAKKKKLDEEQSSPKQPVAQPTESASEDDVEDDDDDQPHRIPEHVWRSLRLNPDLDVREFHDRYLIAGQLPGVRRQDLNVDLSPNNTLKISGVRLPSEKEEGLLRTHVHTAWTRNPNIRKRVPVLSKQEEDRLVLEMANGKYGSFSETYRLPGTIDKQRISASLEKGILQVTIPKIRAPVQRGPFHGDYYW